MNSVSYSREEASRQIDNFLKECEYHGGAKSREALLESSYWKNVWDLGEQDDVNEEVLFCAEQCLRPLEHEIKQVVEQLPFDEALQETEKIIQAESRINTERKVLRGNVWADNLLEAKVTPENLKQFLESPLENLVFPTAILVKMNKKDAPAKIRKMMIEKYGNKIDFRQLPLFGKTSIFREFEDRETREKGAVSIVLALMSSDENLYRKKSSYSVYSNYEYEAVDAFSLGDILNFFAKAVASGVVPDNYKDITEVLGQACRDLDPCFSERVHRDIKEQLANIEIEIEKTLEKMPEGIVGKGLEFVPASGGARRIYLNGSLVANVANAEFSAEATNGKVIAWIVRERIDHCSIKGDQNRDTVFVWKTGWEKPKDIFEDHAYATERYFRVFSPDVTSDGKVKVKRINGEKIIEKEFIV